MNLRRRSNLTGHPDPVTGRSAAAQELRACVRAVLVVAEGYIENTDTSPEWAIKCRTDMVMDALSAWGFVE